MKSVKVRYSGNSKKLALIMTSHQNKMPKEAIQKGIVDFDIDGGDYILTVSKDEDTVERFIEDWKGFKNQLDLKTMRLAGIKATIEIIDSNSAAKTACRE